MVAEGCILLAHDRILRGADIEELSQKASPSLQGLATGNDSQNSAKAVLLSRQRLKGKGCKEEEGGSRENSGNTMKDEPCR